MKKCVLIVDKDPAASAQLKESVEKRLSEMSAITAADGIEALEKLESSPINLVVTSEQLPQMDGFALLEQISRLYPDIPVILIADTYKAGSEQRAREMGAVGFFEKPYVFEQLSSEIQLAVQRQSEGGVLHNISAAFFIQLVEMEEKNCTIRLYEPRTGKYGVLFIKKGLLLDARHKSLRAKAAAYEIFCWDDVSLQVENSCPSIENKIQKELNAVLLEAMRLKDEDEVTSDELPSGDAPATKENEIKESPPETKFDVDQMKALITKRLGATSGLEDIYKDNAWTDTIAQFKACGDALGAGAFKVAYIATEHKGETFLLPHESTVISVNKKCHRDHMMEILYTLN